MQSSVSREWGCPYVKFWPLREGGGAGAKRLSLGRQGDVMNEAQPWPLSGPAAAGIKAGSTGSPARVQDRAPSSCCSCCSGCCRCAVAGPRGAHRAQRYRVQLWKTGPVCQAASGLQLSSSTDWDLWSLEMRWVNVERRPDWETSTVSERWDVCLGIQTSCLMHIWFKLRKICSIYQGKTMTIIWLKSSRQNGFLSLYSCPVQVIIRYLESCI